LKCFILIDYHYSIVEIVEWWGTGAVICLERDADLHMAQLMPLPLTVCYFSKIQIGFTFLLLAHLGSPRKRAVKRVCVCIVEIVYFAYGPADATAIPKPHHLLPDLNPDWFYLSGTGLPGLSWKIGR